MTERLGAKMNLDFDGTSVWGPVPFNTYRRLKSGTYKSPIIEQTSAEIHDEVRAFEAFCEQPGNALKEWFQYIRHVGRNPVSNFYNSVEAFNRHYEKVDVVSGRPYHLQGITQRQLEKSGVVVLGSKLHAKAVLYDDEQGRPPAFIHSIQLNHLNSASRFKANVVRRDLELGYHRVDCVEDDLTAAWRMAHVDPSLVHIYLINNASNNPDLLEKNGVVLPENIIRVESLAHVAELVSR